MLLISEVKIGSYGHKSDHKIEVFSDLHIEESIYLSNDCDENNVEDVLIHEFIHEILYHLLDGPDFLNLLPELVKKGININEYLKKSISSNYDSRGNYFSTLFENWNSPAWN